MSKSILFIHHQSHIGGGQTYISELYKASQRLGFTSQLMENPTVISLIRTLFVNKNHHVIWGIYSDFPLFIYTLSCLLGKQNHFIIYGIWPEEIYTYRETQKPGLFFKLRILKIKYSKYFLQFCFILFSASIVHLSRYGEKLFNSWFPYLLLPHKQSVVIYAGADPQFFNILKHKKNTSSRSRNFTLLMVGRIDSRKNYIHALEIVKYLKNKNLHTNINLIYIFSHGKHNSYDYLTTLGDQIRHHGLGTNTKILLGLNKYEIAQYYKGADVLLMLSTKLETFGLVTLEAIRCGCPVFGYDCCATPEIISKYTSLFLSSSPTPLEVAQKINDFYALPLQKRRNILKELRLATNKYTWSASFQELGLSSS